MTVVWPRSTQIDQLDRIENRVTDYLVCQNVINDKDRILIQWQKDELFSKQYRYKLSIHLEAYKIGLHFYIMLR